MSGVRVHILGPMRVSQAGTEPARLSKAVRQLIALIAASGTDGISRDDLAHELWGSERPESWQSAIRNRITAARKALGTENVLNVHGQFHFANSVTIDSWDVINRSGANVDSGDRLAFLTGQTLAGIDKSPLISEHIKQVADARAVMIQQLVMQSTEPLSPVDLQTLRSYQRLHPLEPAITTEVVRAHLLAGQPNQARTIIDEVTSLPQPEGAATDWIDELSDLATSAAPRRRRADHFQHQVATSEEAAEVAEAAEAAQRADLFQSAARDNEWSVALEIATADLPEAERCDGDPERLKLLECITVDKLEPSRKFSYCLIMARHLLYAGREDEALSWSHTARSLASSADQELLAFITGAIVGDTVDERAPLPLPAAFAQTTNEAINMQSLQVAVISHLERAPLDEAAPLLARFNDLVEASADPYRRWHRLMLEAMSLFVDGDIDQAAELSIRTAKYAELFGIADGEFAMVGQLTNAWWVDGFSRNYVPDYPSRTYGQISLALQAAQSTNKASADDYVGTFDLTSGSYFTVPRLMIVAARLVDPALRERVIERLKKRSGTSAIWGSGVLHLGPVDRVLAQMMDNNDDRDAHLMVAVHCADQQRLRLWQVVCRLDLAFATGNREYRQQAKQLATTPYLESLMTEYRGI